MGRAWDDRVAEYVDSPLMRQRLRCGPTVRASIHGTLGVYRVELDTKRKRASCTCPSEIRPCKHVEALRQTLKDNPASFTDVDWLLANHLKGATREALVDAVRRMVLLHPPSLAVLGVKGFEDIDPWDEDVEDDEGFEADEEGSRDNRAVNSSAKESRVVRKQRIDELIAEATVDAYNESEQETGFLCMLDQNFETPVKARLAGKEVQVSVFDQDDAGIVAVVGRSGKRHRVHLLDLDFGKSPPPGHEWVEAYKVWRKGFA